jgi:hypothetical protein
VQLGIEQSLGRSTILKFIFDYRRVWFLVILALFAGTAYAGPPNDADIHRVIAVSRFREGIAALPDLFEIEVKKEIRQYVAIEDLDPQQQQWIRDVTDAMRRELSWNALGPVAFEAYRLSYDRKDVLRMIRVYRTPAVQRVMNATPLIFRELVEGRRDKEAIRSAYINDEDWAEVMKHIDDLSTGEMGEKTRRFNAMFDGVMQHKINEIERRYGDLPSELRDAASRAAAVNSGNGPSPID